MHSITSRFFPLADPGSVVKAIRHLFGSDPCPLHEVDAYLLQACLEPAEATALRNQVLCPPYIKEGTQSDAWLLTLREVMCGDIVLATVQVHVQEQRVHEFTHCTLTISHFAIAHKPRSLPYDLRRVAVIKIADAIWTAIEREFQFAADPMTISTLLKRAS